MSKNTVNPRLRTHTRTRTRRVVENDEFAAFTRRIIRAYARRVAEGDIDALPDMLRLADDLESLIRSAVIGLRQVGYSWTDIANRLNITRQAVSKRWGGDHQ